MTCNCCGRAWYRHLCAYCEAWAGACDEWYWAGEYGIDRVVTMLVTAIQTDSMVNRMAVRGDL
jgi:hypothetical protein